jgi:hypothetical protein
VLPVWRRSVGLYLHHNPPFVVRSFPGLLLGKAQPDILDLPCPGTVVLSLTVPTNEAREDSPAPFLIINVKVTPESGCNHFLRWPSLSLWAVACPLLKTQGTQKTQPCMQPVAIQPWPLPMALCSHLGAAVVHLFLWGGF